MVMMGAFVPSWTFNLDLEITKVSFTICLQAFPCGEVISDTVSGCVDSTSFRTVLFCSF